ncbi:hypothetical protein GQ44DRAFT_707237 [Phaeosphaeriaceae sp. PMI808]|nr:hypothetical protein GQ44DRAFT_707237 [Phaeosphaeriaceae sp. PMI808]
MWSRFTGRSDAGSSAPNRDKDDEGRRHRTSDSTRAKRDRDSDLRSVISSASIRKPSRQNTAPSSIASFATAFDEMPRVRASDDDDRWARRRDDRPSSYAESSVSTARRDRSQSRDRDEKDRKRSRDHKDKDKKSDKRRSTRSERSGSSSQVGGYRGDIVDSPKQPTRIVSGQIASDGFSQFPGQAGAPLMSGALPPSTPNFSRPPQGQMSSHVQDQFPGQNPAQYTSSTLPGGDPFGAAAEYYQDQGQSVGQQPGVRPQPPSVIVNQDTPHLMAATQHANPVADTGSGAAADFYGGNADTPPSKPTRPSTMPGSFYEDDPAPHKQPRPASSKPNKPNKPGKLGPAATMAGGAAVGYAMGHSSSNTHQSNTYNSSNTFNSTSYTNGTAGLSHSAYDQGGYFNTANGSSHAPPYSNHMEDIPPPKPPRPGKPEKHSSGSNAGLYAAGAAGLAAYGLHQHNSHSDSHAHSHAHSHNHLHNHSASTSGAYPGQNYNNGNSFSYNSHIAGGMVGGSMAHQHQHTGPVSRFVDWWKDHEDVQKMEEYTEYIGVCKHCFDPRSSVYDAPRKHHYNRRRSSEYMRPSGGIEKQSRYGLKEKKSHSSLSSGDERRKKHNSNATGWVAAGLGGIGLVKAGKAVLGRDDFDDTYSIKSGRHSHSRVSGHSRSRSRERKGYSYGNSEVRRSSRSRDRMSELSFGVTKDKKDHRIVRRHSQSHSRSSSSSRDGKSGFGTALGAGLAAAALGTAISKKGSSRSRSKSPKKVVMQHRRDSSDDERRRRRSQQLRRKSSRSSTSGASVIDISQNTQSQAGFLGGFFAAPPPKLKRQKSITSTHKKKTKGFFTFSNGSASSSDSEMAFGTGYVQRRRRSSPKRRNSDERLKATLAGLGATAAAIAAAKAARSSGKRHSEVVAIKQHRNQRKNSGHSRPGSRYGDDEWEDLPDDDTSDSFSDGGLVYGDHDWRKGKSQESLVSNGSGTNKWGWRWGFGKKKKKSLDTLYDNTANTSLIGPGTAGVAGAITGAAIGSHLGRHDSESSSAHTLQTVYPVASPYDPTAFDARRTSSITTSQPLITSGSGAISIHQPQPMPQVPGSMYSTQAPSQSTYTAPIGPSFTSQAPGQPPYPTQYQTQNVIVQAAQPTFHPPLPRRANSSPIKTSLKRDAGIAALAATAGAAVFAAATSNDRTPGSPGSNVRFNLTKEQADKDDRTRRREKDRLDEEDRQRHEQLKREEDARREDDDHRRRMRLREEEEARQMEEDRRRAKLVEEERRRAKLAEEERRREQIRREQDAHEEEERRRRELLRQQDEARKYMEADRLAKIETERRADERRRQEDETRAREAREAQERERRQREVQAEAQRRLDMEAEAEQMRKERQETERREFDRIEAQRRDIEIRADTERRQREAERQESSSQYGNNACQRKLEQQYTGSSVASDVRRKEKQLDEREREIMQPDTRKSTVASAAAAGAAAAIANAAISSYKGKEKEKSRDKERERRRDSSPAVKNTKPSSVKTYEPENVEMYRPSSSRTYEPTNAKTYEPSIVSTYEPSIVSTYEPSIVSAYEPSMISAYEPTNVSIGSYEPSEVSTVIPFKPKTYEPSEVSTVVPVKSRTYEPSEVSTVVPSKPKTFEPSVITYAPSNVQQDYAHDEIFDPNMFKRKRPVTDDGSSKTQTPDGVFKDWESRYNEPPVTQAEFFATELEQYLKDDKTPKVRKIDPNEGATNLTMSEAHDESSYSHSMAPPYPSPYAFVATRDGKASHQTWPVPSLNLIAPTPPGSRAPSVRSVSVPPSPAIEPVEEIEDLPVVEEANRARSRVSWGENQFHHFEVHTPDSFREQFVSDNDLKKHDKTPSTNDMTVEQESPKSGQKVTTYQAYHSDQADKDFDTTTYEAYHPPQATESSEYSTSSQSSRSDTTYDWNSSIISKSSKKKSSKKEQKKAKAAVATATAVAAASAASAEDWERHKREMSSVVSNPFSDSHAAASTVAPSTVASSVPSSSGAYRTPSYESASDIDFRGYGSKSTKSPTVEKDESVVEPETMHIPGSFDEPPMSDTVITKSIEQEWDSPSKTNQKGKKRSKSTDDIVIAQDTPKRIEVERTPQPKKIKDVTPEPEVLSKKERKKKSKASKRMSMDSWEMSDTSPLSSPVFERDIRDVEPSSSSAPTQQSAAVDDTSRSAKSSSSFGAAAMAGGFAALLGTAMQQDQARISADSEHVQQSLKSAEKQKPRETPSSPPNGTHAYDYNDRVVSVPSTAFDDNELPDAITPRRKKEKRHSSGRWSPTIGSPLRTETRYEDYMGTTPSKPTQYDERPLVEAPKPPTESDGVGLFNSRNVYDSGYHAPDDAPRKEPAERDSDEFFSAGSEEREKEKNKARESVILDESCIKSPSKYEGNDNHSIISPKSKHDDDTRSVGSSRSKYDDDPDREERHRRRREAKSESREQSRDRSYGLEDGGERRRRHRRHETDDIGDDWETKSTVSEARSETNGERKHRHRRHGSERDGSVESVVRHRSTAGSEPGDLNEERKSHRRKSRKDDDDNVSLDDRNVKKEKEKRSSGLFGIFSKSKESLADTPSKSLKSKDDDEEEGKKRRRKHRSDRGSTYGSDDDDARSTISSSSRREKRSSRSERGEGDRRESYDDKVHRSSYAR